MTASTILGVVWYGFILLYVVVSLVTSILNHKAEKKRDMELGIFWAHYDTALERRKRRKCYEKETCNDGSGTGSDDES